jgi:hypothetical protein
MDVGPTGKRIGTAGIAQTPPHLALICILNSAHFLRLIAGKEADFGNA